MPFPSSPYVPDVGGVLADRLDRLNRAERYVREHHVAGDDPLARRIAAWVSAGGPAPWENEEEGR